MRSATLGALLFVPGVLGACAPDSSSPSEDPGPVDFVFSVVPDPELATFTANIVDLRLTRDGKVATGNVVGATGTRLELLGLEEQAAWVRSVTVPFGTYDGVRATLEPGSIEARDKAGADVALTVDDPVLVAGFDAPIQVDGERDYERVRLELDLVESLSGAGVLLFDGAADAFPDDGGSLQRLDELRGIVRSTKDTRDIYLDAWVDDDLEQPLGKVRVTILDPNKVGFYDRLQDEYPDVEAFFADLVPGQTLLEVQADLSLDGILIGRSFIVEGDDGAPQYPNEVKFEGYVVGLPTDALDLAWTKIESGVDLAEPVLGSLGDPAVLTGDLPAGVLVLNANGQEVPATSLAVGQKVEVVFPDFDGLNFLLTRVRILEDPTADVTITDVSGLTDEIVVHVGALEPWVVAGDVPDDTTDVTVDLFPNVLVEFVLDTRTRPSLDPDELVVGLKAQVRGTLNAGTSTVDADRLRVRPGRLRGLVADSDSVAETITVLLTESLEPFGGGVGETGPYTVAFDPECDFQGAAESFEEIQDLIADVGFGESLEIVVQGIGTANSNEILAFEVETQVTEP